MRTLRDFTASICLSYKLCSYKEELRYLRSDLDKTKLMISSLVEAGVLAAEILIQNLINSGRPALAPHLASQSTTNKQMKANGEKKDNIMK